MTLAEFNAKPLTTNTDAVATIRAITFNDLCSYIANGTDTNVMRLLNGLYISRADFTKEEILNAAVCALFPGKSYMRSAASVTALKLAKAISCERELQSVIRERWGSIGEHECNEFVLGLSGIDDVAGWMPVLPVLFKLSKNNDVRTQLVRAANNIYRSKEWPEARRLLRDFLIRMPASLTEYLNPNNFKFVSGLAISEKVELSSS